MKLAIVHDYLNQMGGAEFVLKAIHDVFPDAPIFTSIYAPERVDAAFRQMDIRTTFMQRLPFVHRHHQAFLPLYPFAFESLDLREFDVVLSMSSGWAKNVLTRPETCHVCYCLTPMRFGWNFQDYVAGEPVTGWQRTALQPLLTGLRLWDVAGANRVDHFVAISSVVKRRIAKYYRRDAAVIYPPVDTAGYRPDAFAPPSEPSASPPPGRAAGERLSEAPAAEAAAGGRYFLMVVRLIPYKRVDLAIQACNRLKAPLKIIGDGRDRPRLEAMAGPTVEFLGWVGEAVKREHLLGCRAFLFPGEDDFGTAPVEAMAAGRPVVAYGAGGALDTVVDGVTGVLFGEQSVDSLVDALEAVSVRSWDRSAIVARASRFDVCAFKTRLRGFVEARAAEHQAAMGGRPARPVSMKDEGLA